MDSYKTNTITSINDGACQIDAGDYRSAIVSLSVALKSCKASAEVVEQGQQTTKHSFDLDLLMSQGPVDKNERSTTDTEDHMAYIRPIYIPDGLGRESGFDAQVVFSVAVFNLALAHHLGGMEDTPSSAILLEKAATLYEFGVHVQESQQSDDSTGILFFLATFNNLGDVHRRLGNTLKSEQCFKQLLSTLMFLTASGEQASSLNLDVFFRSTFFLVCPTHVNAAAVA
jgi:hypothetical protein